ncbi:MAG: CDP-alcohol phosphatidyltransferase family protein [Woeseiaceae bacterium]
MTLHWLPNAISMLRIVLVVPILYLIVDGEYAVALLLFVIAGGSDGIDGYLAVRFNWQTRFGALLDPVADKLLVSGMFITLAWQGLLPVWLAAVVILRDLVIFVGALVYHFLIEPVQGEPSRISKLNTALQLLFLLFVLSRAGFAWPQQISLTTLGAAVLVTAVISGVDYVLRWSDRARKRA